MKRPLNSASSTSTRRRFGPQSGPAAFIGTVYAFVMFCFSSSPISAQQVKVIREWQHDVSPPLYSMVSEKPAVAVLDTPERVGNASDSSTLVAEWADPVV